MHKKFSFSQGSLEVEVGKLARQANGSAWIRSGNNVVLATATASKDERDFMGFFPLTVEYRERMSAVGKIPGGYIKREGKLSDDEVCTSRLIDRSIRPLFPKYYFNELQVLTTVYSADGSYPTSALAMIGASVALTVSDIPFLGPIGAVEAYRHEGQWHFNAAHEIRSQSDTRIVISGTYEGVAMVEGHSNDLSEDEFVDVLFKAHDLIKEQIEWQKQIAQELNIPKIEVTPKTDWEHWEKEVNNFFPDNFTDGLFQGDKAARRDVIHNLREQMYGHFVDHIEKGEVAKSVLNFLFNNYLKVAIPDAMAAKNTRIDDRSFDAVRPIEVEVDVLAGAHGSSVFTRGETQVLASLTLGTAQDAQKIDKLLTGMHERFFMLHYNFPPFCVGEVRPMRGVSRREIGHGYLAETSFYNVLPSMEDFPYTIRSVADVLESNGSSSMASVCSTSMAMMAAGVPIRDMVGGIAMGLIQDSSGKSHILTDILGSEDAYGLMDFKVTGTTKGIMAIQMDIKLKSGLTKDLMKRALDQAREGRLHILGVMRKVLDKPRPELAENAPRVISFKVDQDKIGGIIGPGGKTIKEIIAKTEAQIDISDDGTVRVFAVAQEQAEAAQAWIRVLAGEIEVGSEYEGIVRRITDFGIFVELVPGKDGLLHISMIDRELQNDLANNVPVGSKLHVKVMAYEKDTGRVRLAAQSIGKKPRNDK